MQHLVPASCALALLGVACHARAQSTRASRIDQYLKRCAAHGWNGSVLVARGGRVLLAEGYGFADRARRIANTKETLFEIASITKQLTAAAILKLQEAQKLDVGDRIANHLPGVPESCAEITIHDLLTHTSGIPGRNSRGSGDDLELAVRTFLGNGPVRPRGEKWEYWNGGYALLAGIIERASKMAYTEFCRQELFAPAGMSDTGFTGDEMPGRTAAIGTGRGKPRSALEHPYRAYGYQYRGMGGAVTNVLDLYKWDRALREDDVLGAAAKKTLFAPLLNDYACGWYVRRKDRHTQSHGGGVRGFQSELRRYPDDNGCLIVLSNRDDIPLPVIVGNVEAMMFAKRPPYPLPPPVVPIDDAALERLQGPYASAHGARVVVRAAEGALHVGVEGQAAVEAVSSPAWPGFQADAGEIAKRARAIVEAVTRGDARPLRDAMQPGIPPSWPDTVVATIWPPRLEKLGKVKLVRSLGVVVRHTGAEAALALEHERGTTYVKVVFRKDGLGILDFDGPEFPVSVTAMPTGNDVFTVFLWQRELRLRFERGRDGHGAALHIGGLRLPRE